MINEDLNVIKDIQKEIRLIQDKLEDDETELTYLIIEYDYYI